MFFFSSRRRHTRFDCDWSSDVCSSDLYKISEAAHAAGNLHDLFAAIHEIVGGLMPAKNFYIALYDPAAELLSVPYFVDEYDTAFPAQRLGKGLTEYVLRTGQALLATAELHHELEQR